MTGLPFPLSGSTLIVGPSNVGKTSLTADALEAWVEREGARGVAVLEFAPELERDGRVLGGRLDRFTTIPGAAWLGVLDAHAPRASAEDEEGAVALARDNARRADRLLAAAPPSPRAVFVNDATIPFQHEDHAADRLADYCEGSEVAVLNAFESEELGVDDPVSRSERAALRSLRGWVERVVEMG